MPKLGTLSSVAASYLRNSEKPDQHVHERQNNSVRVRECVLPENEVTTKRLSEREVPTADVEKGGNRGVKSDLIKCLASSC